MPSTTQQRGNQLAGPSKDTHFKDQFSLVYSGFFKKPQTMKELSVRTGIDRANICWHSRALRLEQRIAVVKKTTCSITGHLANLYTTNPDLFPISSQLKIF